MARKKVPLDEIRLGKEQEHDKTRYQQIQEERINRNFRRLAEDTDEMNSHLTDVDSHLTDVDSRLSYIEGGNFDTPLDVIPRRAYATLSSAGWYRVLTYEGRYGGDDAKGVIGLIIDFDITRDFDSANNEVHSVKLLATYNDITFANECSKSATQLIDKIRWNYKSNDAYVDIHYTGTSRNNVAVCIAVKAIPEACKRIRAESLQAVADAPVGETILTTYNFHATTSALNSTFTFYSTANNVKTLTIPLASSTWQCGLAIGNVNGAGNVCCLVLISGSPSIATLGVSGTVNVLTASVSSGVLTLGLSNASYTFKSMTVIGLY